MVVSLVDSLFWLLSSVFVPSVWVFSLLSISTEVIKSYVKSRALAGVVVHAPLFVSYIPIFAPGTSLLFAIDCLLIFTVVGVFVALTT